MENTAYVALSRQMMLRLQMDAIANNMANLSTPAFKSQTLIATADPEAITGGSMAFASNFAIERNFAPGPMSETGSTFDIAIHGDGFFAVSTPDGPQYTRLGRFQLDAGGTLVTGLGDPVLDELGAPIVVPQDEGEIAVARDGTISTASGRVARLQAMAFDPEAELTETAGGYFESDAPPLPNAEAQMVQGMIEGSNVNGVLEMTALIEVSRSYQAAQRLIDQEYELQRRAVTTILGTA